MQFFRVLPLLTQSTNKHAEGPLWRTRKSQTGHRLWGEDGNLWLSLHWVFWSLSRNAMCHFSFAPKQLAQPKDCSSLQWHQLLTGFQLVSDNLVFSTCVWTLVWPYCFDARDGRALGDWSLSRVAESHPLGVTLLIYMSRPLRLRDGISRCKSEGMK